MGARDYTSALHLRMTCSYRLSRQLQKDGLKAWGKDRARLAARRAETRKMCVSAWRNGSQQANHDGQQQKTTQEQSELAHWNLYNVMTNRRGRPS